ncbi:trigger factor [Spirochaetota bacterium]
MKISEKKLENATMELEIEVPADRVGIEYKFVFDKIQKSVKIDGFRKGKAPLSMVEQKYLGQADKEVAENIVKAHFGEAINEKDYRPISQPAYNFDKIDRNEPFKFTVTFEIFPTLTIGKYKDISVNEKTYKIADDDIMSEIETVRDRQAVFNPKDPEGKVEEGDSTLVMIKRIDDISKEEIDGREFKEYTIIVGKNKQSYSFDEHTIGMKVDETKEVEITYPEDYYIKDLAGVKATYIIGIKDINVRELPELNEEFSKKMGYESVDDMKEKTGEFLEKFVSQRCQGESKTEIMMKIIEDSKFDLPLTMINAEMNEIFNKTQQRVGFFEKDIEKFATALGLKLEEFQKRLRDEAEQTLKSTLILSEVAKNEELKISEEKYNQAIEGIAKSNNQTKEQIEKIIEENKSRENIESEMLLDLAMEFIYDSAKVKKLKPVSVKELLQNSQ